MCFFCGLVPEGFPGKEKIFISNIRETCYNESNLAENARDCFRKAPHIYDIIGGNDYERWYI